MCGDLPFSLVPPRGGIRLQFEGDPNGHLPDGDASGHQFLRPALRGRAFDGLCLLRAVHLLRGADRLRSYPLGLPADEAAHASGAGKNQRVEPEIAAGP